ncbi:MAG: DUF1579 family protein [Planctomycetaceae bacterium]|nr:DUF1579 family protein [Planctomycetaceae bacterium]
MPTRLYLALAGILALTGCGTSSVPVPATPSTVTPATPTETPLSAVVVSETSPIATLLGKPVLSRDCLSPAGGIGSVEVGISNLVLSVLMDEFCQSRQLTLTQEEIDSFWKTMRAGAQRANPDPTKPLPEPAFDEPAMQARLRETQSKLAAPDLPWLERMAMQGRERALHMALEHKSNAAAMAYEHLTPLRCQAALYKHYGGKVVARQISMEPAGAYVKLVQEAEASGKLQFHNEGLKQAFWKRMNDALQHSEVPPERVDFSLPVWMQGIGALPARAATASPASHPATPGSDAMLPHFVGAWSTAVTSKPTKQQLEQMQFQVQEVTDLTLKNRFLIGRELSQPDGVKRLWLMTYDKQRNAYPFWMFDSNGLMGGEWSLTWDDAQRTATGRASDTPVGWTSLGTNHFPDANTNLVAVWMRDDAGRLLFDSESKKTRQPLTAREATLTAWSQTDPEKAKPSPEQDVLGRLIGEWASTTVSKPAEWTPQEVRTTATLKREWILDGQFLLDTSQHSDGQEALSLYAYDSPSKSYRSWWFNSEGQHDKTQGTWDEATQTLKYQADQEGGRRLLTSIHFVSADRHDWQVTVTGQDGKLYLQLDGTVIRQKQ